MTGQPASKSICPSCGAQVSSDAPRGYCLKCLFALGTNEVDAAAESASQPSISNSQPIPLRSFGDYELLEEIARGGMGIIYKARQKSLDRIVAMKMLLFGGQSGKDMAQRFRAEAAAAASLQHPNIVAIHEVNAHEGQPFFVMDFVEGQNLAQLNADCESRHLGWIHRAARYVKILAEAIHYAHERGILHRDLKPSNVLIDSFDQPRVTDFGLAKHLHRDSELTLTGQVLGSPNYMPPEQATAKRGLLGRRSDVYSIGAILYDLLTGRAPFIGETLTDTLQDVVNTEPISPRLLNPSVPRDLETICLKCLEKQPDKRYATAQQLAEELNRFLCGESILARPVSAPEKVWRWCYRKPAFAASLLLTLILILILIVGSPIALIRINRARKQSETLRKQDEQLLYIANMRLAQAGWDENNVGLVGNMLKETEAAPYHGFEWFYWQRQTHLAARTLHFPSTQKVIALSVSPDGQRLVSGGDDPLRLWDVAAGREPQELLRLKGHNGSVFAVAFSSDGARIISGGQDKTARIWETASGREIRKLEGATGQIEYVAFSRDGRRVLTGSNDNKVRMWDADTAKALLEVPGNPCAFSPDGRQILTGVNNGTTNNTAVLWDATDGHEITRFKGHTESIMSVAFSPDGTRFVTGSRDLTARVWEVATGRELLNLRPHGQAVNVVSFSRNGERIATASVDQAVRVWDANNGQLLFTFKGHGAEVEGLAFFPDGRIVSSAQDATIKFWDADGPRETRKFGGDNSPIWGLAFSPDARRLATGTYNCEGRMWDLETGRERFRFPGAMLSISPDGRQMVAVQGSLARLFDSDTGQQIRKFAGHSEGIHSVVFCADGQRIVTVAVDHLAILWDATSGKELHRLTGHTAPVVQADFSPDGNRVLTVSRDETARIWSSSSGAESDRFTEHRNEVLACAFSPDGQWIATGDAERTILLWEAATKRVIHTLRGHSSAVQSLAFSPDGRRILSASEDGTARLWDSATGQEILVLKGHNGPIVRAVFSRDGRQIATGGRDGIAQVWESATPEQVAAWTAEATKMK